MDSSQSTVISIAVIDKDFNIDTFNRFIQLNRHTNADDTMGKNILDPLRYLYNDWSNRFV